MILAPGAGIQDLSQLRGGNMTRPPSPRRATRHSSRDGKGQITNKMNKTTLPIQDILGVNFYFWGYSFQFRASFCGKNLKFTFKRQILFY